MLGANGCERQAQIGVDMQNSSSRLFLRHDGGNAVRNVRQPGRRVPLPVSTGRTTDEGASRRPRHSTHSHSIVAGGFPEMS